MRCIRDPASARGRVPIAQHGLHGAEARARIFNRYTPVRGG